jgi:anti-sigma regulatory factor (Ser/Thr protein kinase)
MLERRFGRSLGSLDAIFAFVAEFLASQGLDRQHAFEIDLIIEELFTNMVKYSTDGRQDVAIALERRGHAVTIVLRDFEVEPFDVSRAPGADVERPIAERTPGGLGLHLVRQMADSIAYQYRDRTSTITVTRRLEP